MSGDALRAELADDRVARLCLSLVAEPGDRRLGALVDRHGPSGVACALLRGEAPGASGAPVVLDGGGSSFRFVEGVTARHVERYAARLAAARPSEVLAAGSAAGARYVCPGDLEWPTQLDDLGPGRPLGLWVRGDADLRRWALRSVAVVGARACTEYGRTQAADLAASLADRGWAVFSGGAFGIDAAAHRGALVVGGATVAVLACGVDVFYPKGNAGLLSQIRDDGLVVSELPPGAGVTKSRFLERNRVIAAMTRGTVVIEAALRSGALNTATRARTLHRLVMAMPGPVTSPLSAGCHEVMRTGGASLITDAADVLDLVGELGVDAQPRRREDHQASDSLAGDSLRVFEALPSRKVDSLDALASKARLDMATLARCLGELEAYGLAECRAGGWRMVGAGKSPS